TPGHCRTTTGAGMSKRILVATRRIKGDASLHSIPIIAVTSYALSGEEKKARAAGCNALSGDQRVMIAGIAAGFAGLLSLFNIGGRFFWASLSDYIGRKNTYYTFFVLGIVCYLLMPWSANAGSKAVFVGAVCIILSMYGGGFATVPAYLADM